MRGGTTAGLPTTGLLELLERPRVEPTLRWPPLLRLTGRSILVEPIAHSLSKGVDARVAGRRFRLLITDALEVTVWVESARVRCQFDGSRLVVGRGLPQGVRGAFADVCPARLGDVIVVGDGTSGVWSDGTAAHLIIEASGGVSEDGVWNFVMLSTCAFK